MASYRTGQCEFTLEAVRTTCGKPFFIAALKTPACRLQKLTFLFPKALSKPSELYQNLATPAGSRKLRSVPAIACKQTLTPNLHCKEVQGLGSYLHQPHLIQTSSRRLLQ